MRELLFRAKSLVDGKWHEGMLISIDLESDGNLENEKYTHCIVGINTEFYRGEIVDFTFVDPETIGQYTGFNDKNGKRIFEGDIISTRKSGTRTERLYGYFGTDSEGYPQKVPGYDGYTDYHYSCQIDCLAKVAFSPRYGFYLDGSDKFVDAVCNEVVGNIHDNPNLLKGEKL